MSLGFKVEGGVIPLCGLAQFLLFEISPVFPPRIFPTSWNIRFVLPSNVLFNVHKMTCIESEYEGGNKFNIILLLPNIITRSIM